MGIVVQPKLILHHDYPCGRPLAVGSGTSLTGEGCTPGIAPRVVEVAVHSGALWCTQFSCHWLWGAVCDLASLGADHGPSTVAIPGLNPVW